jgi:transcription elongation GreA/GreB family factor
MNKKTEVIEQIVKYIENALVDIDKAFTERVEAAREAESRNQSRYDTKGWEAAREAEGIKNIRSMLELQQKYFNQVQQKIKSQNSSSVVSKITSGSLVRLQDQSGNSMWIYLVTCPGGIDIQDISVVSTTAPLAQRILNRVNGETVLQAGRGYTIMEIL